MRRSKTAAIVCKARAFAAKTRTNPTFDDPTAILLLSDVERAEVERAVAMPSRSLSYVRLVKRGAMMMVRTLAIDDAVRVAGAPQVLGAGLDDRAWRMPELSAAVVFEVDHPESQRDKCVRVGVLSPRARDVRFVSVDFTSNDLDGALDAAGHDAAKPTMWIWEGVVMYLTHVDIERTLDVVERRSREGSRLVVLYFAPRWILPILGVRARLLGEPLRSIFTAAEMRALLAHFHFRVLADDDIPTLAARLSPALASDNAGMEHLRLAVAEL